MKLSIITINRNNAKGLQKTVNSVINQIFTDYEYIIIDGGSDDGSVDIIERYKNKINYWVSELDNGIYHAMNKGIHQSKGEYCLFLNSGDCLIAPDVLKKAFEGGRDTDLLICRQEKQEFNIGLIQPKEKITFYDFFVSSLPHASTFIKRSLFENIGQYKESYQLVSDWIFFLEAIIKYRVSYSFVDVVLASFEEGGVSSSSKELHLKERNTYLFDNYKYFISDYQELNFYKTSRMIKFWISFKKRINGKRN